MVYFAQAYEPSPGTQRAPSRTSSSSWEKVSEDVRKGTTFHLVKP